jgi:hypothetical protein
MPAGNATVCTALIGQEAETAAKTEVAYRKLQQEDPRPPVGR